MSSLTWHIPQWRVRFWTGLALFMLLIMESTTTALWYQAIFVPGSSAWPLIFATMFAILAVSSMLLRGLAALRWPMAAKQLTAAAWVLLAGYTSLKLLVFPQAVQSFGELLRLPVMFILNPDASGIAFFHLVGMTLLIWRGVSMARNPLTLAAVQFSFQLGLASTLLYGLFFAPMYPREAVFGLYLYLFCGLTAMSLSRIANLSEVRGGRVPRFGLGWFTSILLAGLTIVGLAIFLGWAASGQIADWAVRIFIVVLGVLTALVLLILSPLFLWMGQIVPLLADLLNDILERLRNIPGIEQANDIIERINEGLALLVPVVMAGRGLLLAGILLAVTAGVMLALYLRRIHRELVEEEASEHAEQDPNAITLQKLLQRMLKNARGIRLRRPAQLLAAARIRQIYRQLMLLSQRMGMPRPPSSTPLEFLPQLTGLFPEEQAGLERITNAYVSVRYGAYPETSAEVAEIQAAWERIRRRGRQALAVKKKRSSP